MLPASFTEPKDFEWGHFKNAKGADIRYGSLKAEGESKGTLVILQGFRENIEKYFELVREMHDKGFDVYLMDWRGQGGSERYIKANPQKAHSEGYDENLETLDQFMTTIVDTSGTKGGSAPAKPLIMMAHSMGAHLGLRYLHDHEGVFDSAVLSAPMMDIVTGGLPRPLARQMAKFAKAGNYLEKYIPGGADWNDAADKFDGNQVTHDPDRFEAAKQVLRDKPELQIGDPTYGWVYHAFSSVDILNDEAYLSAIKTPVLMGIAGQDKVVDRPAQERACGILPNCEKIDVPGARHELWMERDDLRKMWTDKVESFLDKRLKAQGPAPKKPNSPGKPRPPSP
ncbi:MAG: alpha/beta fold hydrolase [Alphaproteobacteria bacterium]|nr:alpha/beta fold hydrolase [Alphaproteobacteria bacterium]